MSAHWEGGSGGKGSKPRPFNITDAEYEENMKRIFGDKAEEKAKKAQEKAEYFARLAAETKARLNDNTGVTKNEYQDILSTEDALNGE